MRYDRWLIHKQPCKDIDLCGFPFAPFSEKCFNQMHRALNGDAMLVPLRGAPTWRSWRNRAICLRVLFLKWKVITLELSHIEINTSSRPWTVQLAKTWAITQLLTYARAFSGRHSIVTQRTNLEIQTCSLNKMRNPVELKRCKTLSD